MSNNGLVGRYVEHLDFDETMSEALEMASALPRRKSKLSRSSDVKKNGKPGIARMRVFAVHGCRCYKCGLEGTEIIHTVDNGGGHHVDLYAKLECRYVLMNRDHILPASRGGQSHLWNLAPCCEPCNSSRGNIYTDEDRKLFNLRLKWTQIGKKLFQYMPWFTDRAIYKISMFLAKISFLS